jgi:hypothetical protein
MCSLEAEAIFSISFIHRRCGFSSAGVHDAWTQPSSAPWLGMRENMLDLFFVQGTVVKDGGGGGGREDLWLKKFQKLYQLHTNGHLNCALWLNINFLFFISYNGPIKF